LLACNCIDNWYVPGVTTLTLAVVVIPLACCTSEKLVKLASCCAVTLKDARADLERLFPSKEVPTVDKATVYSPGAEGVKVPV
jgi:hypothetical protein